MTSVTAPDADSRFGSTEPPHHGDERTLLLAFLRRQRALVAWKLEGADEAVLRSVATSTGLTIHGIVRHLYNVERSWLRRAFAGESGLAFDWTDDDPEAELRVPAEVTMAELLAAYAAEAQRCDAVIEEASSLDAVAAARDLSLRWIVLHLIEELARHLGQLDLLREQADGTAGEEPIPSVSSR